MPHRKKNTQQQRQWRRMDLHLHTPASVDYKQSNVSYLDLLKKAQEKKLDIIAFADHNTANGYARYLEEVESLELLERLGRLREDERARLEEYRRLQNEILILPGFEFTATLGFHILGIFPPDTTVRELEHLLLMMRVPPDKLDQGSGEVGATTDALTAYRMIHEAGGLAIAAHANSSHGVAMPGFDFGGQTRIAYTQDPNLDALEVTDLDSKSRRRTAAFFSGTKPEYPRRMHCIQGSDAHKLDFDARYKNEMGIGDRATEILLDDTSFEAIKDVLEGSDFSRTRPYRPDTEEPFDPIREAREQGDNLIQSFHERLHEKRGIARPILEDVVALANTNGGTVYIGASSNPKTSVLGVDRPDQASAELRAAISKEIAPPLEVQVDTIKSQNKNLLQVIVPRGSDAPYALEGQYIYVRSENETGLAMRDEIVQLVRDALAVELAATGTLPVPVETAQPEQEQGKVSEPLPPAATAAPTVEPPRTGVEIVTSEQRKGITYYSVRDLRNNRIVQNVTRTSARRLWQYAIEEQEKHPCDPAKISWVGSVGMCKSHKRGGKTRYDLVQRSDGKLFIYYGVTDDGIHGEWRKLVDVENGAEAEESPSSEEQSRGTSLAEASLEQGTPMQVEESEASREEAISEGEFSEQVVQSQPLGGEPASSAQTEYPASKPEQLAEPLLLVPGSDRQMPESEATHARAVEHPTAEEQAQSQPPLSESVPERSVASPQTEQNSEQVRSEAEPTTPVEASSSAATQSEPPAPPPAQSGPASQSTPAKTRAQQWREILDKAIAEARSAQQSSGPAEVPPEDKRRSGSSAEVTDTAIRHESDKARDWPDEPDSGDLSQTEHDRGQDSATGDDQRSRA